jgi:flagellar motor switch/type III secretory pathway protein FliN
VTPDIRDWLPEQAFNSEALEAALHAAIEDWQAAWFMTASVMRCTLSTSGETAVDREIRVVPQGAARRVLLELALATGLQDAVLTETDHRLLDSFAQKIVEDLVERLEALMGDARTAAGCRLSRLLEISCDGRILVVLRVPESRLVQPLKQRIGASAALVPVGKRTQALQRTPVALEAILGRASLTIDELEGLAAGDILVLEQRIDHGADLRVLSTGERLATCRVHKEGDRVALHLL